MTGLEKTLFKAALGDMCESLAEQAKDEGFYGPEFLQYYNRLLRFVKELKQEISTEG